VEGKAEVKAGGKVKNPAEGKAVAASSNTSAVAVTA